MNRRIRTQSTRPSTHRFKEYLKPGALARLRDSKISTRSHRVNSANHLDIIIINNNDNNDYNYNSSSSSSPSPSLSLFAELPPEFASLDRGPQCFGRKKLGAARSFFVSVSDTGVDPFIISANNLLVH